MRERDEFMIHLARVLPDWNAYCVSELGHRLIRQASVITRHAVNLCNIPDYQERYAVGAERVEKAVTKILAGTPIKSFEVGGDPRGACLKVHMPNGASNTFGGDGYAVPTGKR